MFRSDLLAGWRPPPAPKDYQIAPAAAQHVKVAAPAAPIADSRQADKSCPQREMRQNSGMRTRPPLARRLLYAAIFFVIGSAVLMGIAIVADPVKRCEERGGTFHNAGRWCEEAEPPQAPSPR